VIDVEVVDALGGERVDRTVALLTGLSRAQVSELVAAGVVSIDGRRVSARSTRLETGQRLRVAWERDEDEVVVEGDASVILDVVFEDDDVIVLDKPADLVVHPGAGSERTTLVHGLVARYPEVRDVGEAGRPGVVHRLDRHTSGLMVVARRESAYRALVDQLAARDVTRRYVTLVWGELEAAAGLVDAPLGRSRQSPTRRAVRADGKEARTRYQVRARYERPVPLSLLWCWLETGRTHQIRAHLRAIGHPVVGDERYDGRRDEVVALGRPFLHAAELAFEHPADGRPMRFESALPAELEAVLHALGPAPDALGRTAP